MSATSIHPGSVDVDGSSEIESMTEQITEELARQSQVETDEELTKENQALKTENKELLEQLAVNSKIAKEAEARLEEAKAEIEKARLVAQGRKEKYEQLQRRCQEAAQLLTRSSDL